MKTAGNNWLKPNSHDYLTQWPSESQQFPGIPGPGFDPRKITVYKPNEIFYKLKLA
jgi:hypothetical protein